MNSWFTQTKQGSSQLPVTCDDLKFKEIVISILDGYNRTFTFNQLLEDLCKKFDALNFFVREENTIYEGNFTFKQNDSDKLLKIVWEQIWERKLIIDLSDNTSGRESLRLIKILINEE